MDGDENSGLSPKMSHQVDQNRQNQDDEETQENTDQDGDEEKLRKTAPTKRAIPKKRGSGALSDF
jgi:hypothetical protein